MKRMRAFGAAALLAASAACSTGATRIKAHQAAFDASSPEAQRKICQGEAAVGFTDEQVVMALGHPQRVYAKQTPGAAQEIWVYGLDGGPAAGISPVYGNGDIVVSDAYFQEQERVVFEKGAVVAVFKRLR
jgi:hypothetical protein